MHARTIARLLSAALLVACGDPTSPSPGQDVRPILFIGRTETPGGSRGDPAIYVVRPDGSGLQRLSVDAGQALYPAWSPDGAQIAYARGAEGGNALWIMSADGNNRHRAGVFPGCEYGYTGVTWSPTGDRLAAECFWDTRIFDLRSGASYSLSRALGTTIADPDWSPDGSRIAFGTARDGDLYVAAADGTGGAMILIAQASDPAWARDGRLAFVSTAATAAGIYIVNADGSGSARVTSPDSASADEGPTWSSDAQWIAFHRRATLCAAVGSAAQRVCIPHWSVYVVRSDGSGLRRLTPDSLQATRAAW